MKKFQSRINGKIRHHAKKNKFALSFVSSSSLWYTFYPRMNRFKRSIIFIDLFPDGMLLINTHV